MKGPAAAGFLTGTTALLQSRKNVSHLSAISPGGKFIMHLRWQSLFALLFAAALLAGGGSARATVVRFQFSLNGSAFGTVDVRLFQGAMPRTVTNFLHYVDDNDWDNSVIHRRSATSDSGVEVIQGGGYRIPAAGIFNATAVPADPGIPDEPGGGVAGPSNLPGTIAMAKSGPNTAANEWYFNTINNSVLDAPTPGNAGGFSAFGRVLGGGMTVLSQIVALPRINAGSPFTTIPVFDVARVQSQQNIFPADALITNDVRRLNIPDGDYNFDGKVNAADLAVWKADFGSTTKAEADGDGNGRVDAADLLIWQRTLGQDFGTPTIGAIPEPATGALATIVACALGALRRRDRRG